MYTQSPSNSIRWSYSYTLLIKFLPLTNYKLRVLVAAGRMNKTVAGKGIGANVKLTM